VVEMFDRITFEPGKMGGKACLRGLRIPVSVIVSLVAAGETTESILREYPDLERADIEQALAYAAWLADGRRTMPGQERLANRGW